MFWLVVLSMVVVLTTAAPHITDERTLEMEWQNFKAKFEKVYQPDEEAYRKAIFEENLKFIDDHNKEADLGRKTFWVGINKYADKTQEEMLSVRGGSNGLQKKPQAVTMFHTQNRVTEDLPTHVNWTAEGWVTPVKDQGDCGSCWAFTVTGALEGHHFKLTEELVSLSEQNILDCSGNLLPCNGGMVLNALEYAMVGGINTEQSYPYEAKGAWYRCRFNKTNVGAHCRGYHFISPTENALQQAVAQLGPISVSIDANHSSIHYYERGIYFEPSCTDSLNHGVLLVGYGIDDDQGYWLVKNSWGPSWGENGYMRILRNGSNHCGIANYAVYPAAEVDPPVTNNKALYISIGILGSLTLIIVIITVIKCYRSWRKKRNAEYLAVQTNSTL